MEGFSENAMKILRARYFKRNSAGELDEVRPSQLFLRVARHVSGAEKDSKAREKWEKAFLTAMMNRDFMPNSPTLTGAGRGLCLSACFVLPVEDSLEAIFETVKNAALVHKEGGGTGFDFSRIRPQGSYVRKTQGIASGPVSFLRVIDAGTEAVKQGGTRRGANMGILRVDHPDILAFIEMKRDGQTAQNFNISVAVTEAFINAVEEDGEYDLLNPQSGQVVGQLPARGVFEKMVDAAWRNGDPGLVFIERVNQLNPTAPQGPIFATNPCGEQPLHDYEACNLGSINVANFHRPGHEDALHWDRLGETIHMAVRFLDNVIDVNRYPLEQIRKMAQANRRIGLGIMGFADLLLLMGTRYDSPEALEIARRVADFFKQQATAASRELAAERGSFPRIDKSIYAGSEMRNASVLSIAPTGTISRLAGCSSSIEPVFAFEVVSRILDGEIRDVHPIYARWLEEHPDEPLPDWFVTAGEIAPEDHLKMQEAFQEYVDSAVSKTINFPHEATREDIAGAFRMAFSMHVKGLTVYRDGCRAVQVLNRADAESPQPKERPDALTAVTHKIPTGFGNLYITVTFFNERPFEVFCSIGKSGYSTMADAEAIGRLASLALRSGIPAAEVAHQLKGIGGSEPTFHNGELVQSIPDAIAKVLESHVGTVSGGGRDLNTINCPVCGATLTDEKCPTCPNCGWSRCTGT